MSKNCIQCVVNPRTGGDLLCDTCRNPLDSDVGLLFHRSVRDTMSMIITYGDGVLTDEQFNQMLTELNTDPVIREHLARAVRNIHQPKLSFEEWAERYGDEATIKAAETGSDREGDYNAEDYAEREYQKYLSAP